MRERITIKFNVSNAVASGIQRMNAQASLVHQIATIEIVIGPIRAIENTIAGIAIVETIEMKTAIRADMMTRVIENGTGTEMTNDVRAIETADIQEKTARTLEIAIETVNDRTDPIRAIAGATHLIQTLAATISSTPRIPLQSCWNSTLTQKSREIKFVAS